MVENYVYHKFSRSKVIFLIYVSITFLLISTDVGIFHESKNFLYRNFERRFSGRLSQHIFQLLQKSYIEKFLSRFGISCRSSRIQGTSLVAISVTILIFSYWIKETYVCLCMYASGYCVHNKKYCANN